MVVSRDDVRLPGSEAHREWVRPAVTRLAAGSAEDGGGMTVDAGINPS